MAQKKTCSSDHLSYLKAGGGNGGQQLLVSGHISGVFQIHQVGGPSQPQGILSKYLGSGIGSGKDRVGASEGGVVHRNRQHVVQAKGQQQTLKGSVDKGRQNRRGGRGICDPDAECVDSGLNNRPNQSKNQ